MAKQRRKAQKKNQAVSWEELNSSTQKNDELDYSVRNEFVIHDKIAHPKFGIGFVQKIVDDTKMEVLFADKSRLLMQNLA